MKRLRASSHVEEDIEDMRMEGETIIINDLFNLKGNIFGYFVYCDLK